MPTRGPWGIQWAGTSGLWPETSLGARPATPPTAPRPQLHAHLSLRPRCPVQPFISSLLDHGPGPPTGPGTPGTFPTPCSILLATARANLVKLTSSHIHRFPTYDPSGPGGPDSRSLIARPVCHTHLARPPLLASPHAPPPAAHEAPPAPTACGLHLGTVARASLPRPPFPLPGLSVPLSSLHPLQGQRLPVLVTALPLASALRLQVPRCSMTCSAKPTSCSLSSLKKKKCFN